MELRKINTHALPEPADKIVAEFVEAILRIEPDFIDGVYLTGSLSMNDFYSNKSDIDFLVLCKALPDKKTAAQLEQIHGAISKKHGKPDLNGIYLASDSIQTDQPDAVKTLSFQKGIFRYGNFEMAPVSLSELKSNAITLIGQKAETLQIGISQELLYRFLYENLNSYWTRWLRRHSFYLKRRLLLILLPGLTEWSVLGVGRQLCTLNTGKIVSKTEAGHYCLQELPGRFHPIIREALEIRKGMRIIRPSFRRSKLTIACVSYIISTFNASYQDMPGSHGVNK